MFAPQKRRSSFRRSKCVHRHYSIRVNRNTQAPTHTHTRAYTHTRAQNPGQDKDETRCNFLPINFSGHVLFDDRGRDAREHACINIPRVSVGRSPRAISPAYAPFPAGPSRPCFLFFSLRPTRGHARFLAHRAPCTRFAGKYRLHALPVRSAAAATGYRRLPRDPRIPREARGRIRFIFPLRLRLLPPP